MLVVQNLKLTVIEMAKQIKENGVIFIRDDEKYIKKIELIIDSEIQKTNEMREDYFNLIKILRTCIHAFGLTKRALKDDTEDEKLLTHTDRKAGAKSLLQLIDYLEDQYKELYGTKSNNARELLVYAEKLCWIKEGEHKSPDTPFPFD